MQIWYGKSGPIWRDPTWDYPPQWRPGTWTWTQPATMGWECPRCHKVHAPTVQACDCAPPAA